MAFWIDLNTSLMTTQDISKRYKVYIFGYFLLGTSWLLPVVKGQYEPLSEQKPVYKIRTIPK